MNPAEVILIGRLHDATDDALDRLLDGCVIALQDFSTEELRAMADRRDEIHADGWMQRMIREYVDVWR